MYSWSKDFPTLTEHFFGEGNGPTGKIKPKQKGMTAKKPDEKEKTAKQQTN